MGAFFVTSCKQPTACSESVDTMLSLVGDYRKAINDIKQLDTDLDLDSLKEARNRASSAFDALQEAHFKMLEECGGQQDLYPDQYEENNVWWEASRLGLFEVGSQINIQANFHDPNSDCCDWFKFSVEDSSTSFGFDRNYDIIIRLLMVPAESNYDLFLYSYEDHLELLASSSNMGNNSETITYSWVRKLGVSDMKEFYVEIRFFSGPATSVPYTLEINYEGIK